MKTTQKITTQQIVLMALLIAAEIVLSRFLSIATPLVKIGFAFLPLSIVALLYGPIYSAIAAALADFLGAILFPIAAYFPGFTVTAFIAGLLYGIVLYNKPKKILRVICCVLAVNFTELILNTINIYLMTGQAFWATLPTRLIQSTIMIFVKVITIWHVSYLLVDLKKKIGNDKAEQETIQ